MLSNRGITNEGNQNNSINELSRSRITKCWLHEEELQSGQSNQDKLLQNEVIYIRPEIKREYRYRIHSGYYAFHFSSLKSLAARNHNSNRWIVLRQTFSAYVPPSLRSSLGVTPVTPGLSPNPRTPKAVPSTRSTTLC